MPDITLARANIMTGSLTSRGVVESDWDDVIQYFERTGSPSTFSVLQDFRILILSIPPLALMTLLMEPGCSATVVKDADAADVCGM